MTEPKVQCPVCKGGGETVAAVRCVQSHAYPHGVPVEKVEPCVPCGGSGEVDLDGYEAAIKWGVSQGFDVHEVDWESFRGAAQKFSSSMEKVSCSMARVRDLMETIPLDEGLAEAIENDRRRAKRWSNLAGVLTVLTWCAAAMAYVEAGGHRQAIDDGTMVGLGFLVIAVVSGTTAIWLSARKDMRDLTEIYDEREKGNG